MWNHIRCKYILYIFLGHTSIKNHRYIRKMSQCTINCGDKLVMFAFENLDVFVSKSHE